MKQLADYLRAQANDLEGFDTSIADASLDRATLRKWAAEVEAMETRLNDAYAEGRKDEDDEHGLAGRLIAAWVESHGKPIPWNAAVEISAIANELTDEERARLLALGEVDLGGIE